MKSLAMNLLLGLLLVLPIQANRGAVSLSGGTTSHLRFESEAVQDDHPADQMEMEAEDHTRPSFRESRLLAATPNVCNTPPTLTGSSENEYFGWWVDLSADGSRMVISAPWGSPDFVLVFYYSGGAWLQLGDAIQDPSGSSQNAFGFITMISRDGERVAVYDAKAVKVFELVSNKWTQLGEEFSFGGNYATAGFAMSGTGSRIATSWVDVGAAIGSIQVYDLSKTDSWEPLGDAIQVDDVVLTGETDARSAGPVALNYDGDRLMSAQMWQGGNTGVVLLFDYNKSTKKWTKVGQDLTGIKASDEISAFRVLGSPGDMSGHGIAVNDALDRFAIGMASEKEGRVGTYNFDGTKWHDIGTLTAAIAGNEIAGRMDLSGDGDTLVVEVPGSKSYQEYKYDGTKWNLNNEVTDVYDDEEWGGMLVTNENGSMIAIGVPSATTKNGASSGEVRMVGEPSGQSNSFECGFAKPGSSKTFTAICGTLGGKHKSLCVKNSRIEGKEFGDKAWGSWRIIGCGCCPESLAEDRWFCHAPKCSPDMGKAKFNICKKDGKVNVKACVKFKDGSTRTRCVSPFNPRITKCGGC